MSPGGWSCPWLRNTNLKTDCADFILLSNKIVSILNFNLCYIYIYIWLWSLICLALLPCAGDFQIYIFSFIFPLNSQTPFYKHLEIGLFKIRLTVLIPQTAPPPCLSGQNTTSYSFIRFQLLSLHLSHETHLLNLSKFRVLMEVSLPCWWVHVTWVATAVLNFQLIPSTAAFLKCRFSHVTRRTYRAPRDLSIWPCLPL